VFHERSHLGIPRQAGRGAEAALGSSGPSRAVKDWRKVIGMFQDSEFMREVDEECQRMREAEREAARREASSG
jgi:hypothetical protein